MVYMDIEHIMRRHPDRVPVYVRKSPNAKEALNDLEKHKYLVPNDMTMGGFMCIIRKGIKVDSKEAIFVFISKKNILVPNSKSFGEMYTEHKEDEDKMLHLDFTSENTFG